MRARVAKLLERSRGLLGDERGQAMAEYASITGIFIFASVAAGVTWPYTKDMFEGLQAYIDFYFFALNLALG